MLKLIEDEGKSKGQEAYYDPKFLEALYPFMDMPCKETAAPLLKLCFYTSILNYADREEILTRLKNSWARRLTRHLLNHLP